MITIEKYLVLNKYLLSLFGVSEFRNLQEKLKDAQVGIDSDGRSHFVNVLRSSFKNLKISEYTLLKYDENIQNYVNEIKEGRGSLTLKYFQYLAVLFTEYVLDNLNNRKIEFLNELNGFLRNYTKEHDIEIIDSFTENDLKKLAFWMATGSGKTLIMHINYHQFKNYKLFSPDNIILITPNEGLSKQHIEELQKSNIPCELYAGTLNPNSLWGKDKVLVIEITKFVEEKKGGGVRIPVEVFDGRNLIFVDEGHKGKKSEEQKWATLRNKLAENGFVFEYSATFGQILSEENKETLKEYAKSIIFDYSYKYFYLDGYGKNFSVLNVKQKKQITISNQEFQEAMFIANLLSFYEQLLADNNKKKLAKKYNLEKPLWIFVGTTVTGKKEESDVIQIVEFIKRVIQDEKWVEEWAKKILTGNTNLKYDKDKDIFDDRFKYLKEYLKKYLKKMNIDSKDLYKKVFGGEGNLRLYELKNAEGEIGLKIGENEYFGVISIGDISGFKKQLEKKGFSIEKDAISGSLFDDIKKENSKINILIGSKKFIEGWDTWRVCSMGLLNIGKEQGPQIIQLFGRGVRLKGKDMSLKRSGMNSPIRLLETHNIYGIKADYLSRFLEAIRREEVEFETIEIPVKLQHEDKLETLYTLSKPQNKFEEEEILRLKIDKTIHYTVDLLPKVSIYTAKDRKEDGIEVKEVKQAGNGSSFLQKYKDLLDWGRIWLEILEFKVQRNYWNLVFDRKTLEKIILSGIYEIQSLPEIFEVKDEQSIKLLEDIAPLVIKKYLDLFYRKNAKRFETENLRYDKVKQLPLPRVPELVSEKSYGYEESYGYIVQINKKKKKLVNKIRELTEDLERLTKEDTETLPRVYFDGSLYVPILIKNTEIDKISPEGLVDSEKKFVMGLRKYLKKQNFSYEVYLLRNYPFSGVGFQLKWAGFYPDFIMWVKKGERQIIVFIEPKGLVYTKVLDDEKILFAKKDIKQLEQKLCNKNVILESFILSSTPHIKLVEGSEESPTEDEYINNHVLFLDDDNWPEKLFNNSCNKYLSLNTRV